MGVFLSGIMSFVYGLYIYMIDSTFCFHHHQFGWCHEIESIQESYDSIIMIPRVNFLYLLQHLCAC